MQYILIFFPQENRFSHPVADNDLQIISLVIGKNINT